MSTNDQAVRASEIRDLKLNRETLQDLTEREMDEVEGGRMRYTRGTCQSYPPQCGMTTAATTL